MRSSQTSDLWWKTAVFYCLDVEKFFDGNGDGVGDFEGLTNRVDYLRELGVTCIWLMPFYPTPGKDDGYDVADFYGVDRRLGDHGDFVEFIRAAKDSGMRVIVDFLVNHTSDQHPWFRSALRSKDSKYRDYYVWRSEEPPDTSDKVVFPDKEDSIWSKDENPASGTCTTSTATNRTSTRPTPLCGTRSPRPWVSGWSWVSTASASMPSRSPWK